MLSSKTFRYAAGTVAAAGTAYLVYTCVRGRRLALQAAELHNEHVIIVGGGYAGINCAMGLKGKMKYTLVDAKDKFHHNWAAMRSCTEAGFAQKTFIPYEPLFGDDFLRAKIVNIDTDNKTVKLEDGKELKYDYLVVATGTGGPFPGKLPLGVDSEMAVKSYTAIHDKIKAASKIVCVGGGAVGVELAGDIKEDFSDKEVTLIHPRQELLNYPIVSKKLHDKAKDRLESLGVKLLLGERVLNMKEVQTNGGVVCTDKNTQIPAELVLPCTGLRVHSVAYDNSPLSAKTNKQGQLKVNEYLQVDGYKEVFAVGDCNDVPETKLGMLATQQGTCAAKNIQNLVNDKPLQKYSGAAPFCLSIGRSGGVLLMPFFGGVVLPGNFPARMLKGNDGMVGEAWKIMGQKCPPDSEWKSDAK